MAEPSKTAELGERGEEVVAQWLQSQGWKIIDRRWRCRWGELDLVGLRPSLSPGYRCADTTKYLPTPRLAPGSELIFVEVKTRSRSNWDETGLLAITPSKQNKLWRAANHYLFEHPAYADSACRFDIALVVAQRFYPDAPSSHPGTGLYRQVFPATGQQLVLQDYLEAAFEPG